jgi:hypothetical protein
VRRKITKAAHRLLYFAVAACAPQSFDSREKVFLQLSFLRRAYLPLLLVFCVAFAFRPLSPEDDFWAHASIGRWIWNHQQIPTHTLFVWGGYKPDWIAHSWLTQLVFYGVLQGGGGWTAQGATSSGTGPLVVVLCTIATVALVFYRLWRLWSRYSEPGIVALVLFALGIFAASLRFHPRPELFSAVFLTILLCHLIENHDTNEYSIAPRRWFQVLSLGDWGIVAMFALWANFHGAVMIGMVLLIAKALCDLLQHRLDVRARRSVFLAVLCVLATGLNPFGARAYWSDVWNSTHSVMFAHIVEWRPPISVQEFLTMVKGGNAPPSLNYVIAEALLALAALWMWNSNPQRRWSQAAWIVIMGAMFLRQRRHLWIFAIVCLVVAAANARYLNTEPLWNLWRILTRRKPEEVIPQGIVQLARGGAVLCVALIVAMFAWSARSFRVVSAKLPDGASHVLERRFAPSQQNLRIFNDYENSSYLQWRLNGLDATGRVRSAGRYPLYIDLLNAYPDEVFTKYLDIVYDEEKSKKKNPSKRAKAARMFCELNANVVILKPALHASTLAKQLNSWKDWKRIYSSRDGDVWVKAKTTPR